MSDKVLWGSRTGFILASAGSAIGLGAIWKFPYWAGVNGGASFIIPYIFFTFTIGLGLVMSEVALGRMGRGSVVTALRKAGGPLFGSAGVLAVLTAYLILSFYSVVGGWCAAYLSAAVRGVVTIGDAAMLRDNFAALVTETDRNILWHCLFMSATCATVFAGVSAGIERLSKCLLPVLFTLMIVLAARGLTLPGAEAGLAYLFDFDPETMTTASVFSAMGFTFFSLSLGVGILVTYGAYLPAKEQIVRNSFWILILSVAASILAGLMTMPAVFALGFEPSSGPGLVFITVPAVFSQLPFGQAFTVLFYICLVVSALTSAVSLLEVVCAWLHDNVGLSRRLAVLLCWLTLLPLGALSALSFAPETSLTVFGRTFFDWLDFGCTNLLMPLCGLVVALLTGWRCWPAVQNELRLTGGDAHMSRFIIGICAPLLILITVWQGLAE